MRSTDVTSIAASIGSTSMPRSLNWPKLLEFACAVEARLERQMPAETYVIHENYCPTKLADTVNEALADGWRLHGPLIITALDGEGCTYTQAMVRGGGAA